MSPKNTQLVSSSISIAAISGGLAAAAVHCRCAAIQPLPFLVNVSLSGFLALCRHRRVENEKRNSAIPLRNAAAFMPRSLPSRFCGEIQMELINCSTKCFRVLPFAYHVKLFGPSSHFVIHDAGGVHEQVLEVLKPWMKLGYVTLQDIRDQERFDGYYHNQFMVVNDCLHRYKFMDKWMFN